MVCGFAVAAVVWSYLYLVLVFGGYICCGLLFVGCVCLLLGDLFYVLLLCMVVCVCIRDYFGCFAVGCWVTVYCDALVNSVVTDATLSLFVRILCIGLV